MALAGALCALVHTIGGFTNRSLRAQVATLLDAPYTATQMSYDLTRLRLKGLIRRLQVRAGHGRASLRSQSHPPPLIGARGRR